MTDEDQRLIGRLEHVADRFESVMDQHEIRIASLERSRSWLRGVVYSVSALFGALSAWIVAGKHA